MVLYMERSDFYDLFGGIFDGKADSKPKKTYSEVDELNDLWQEYTELIEDIKASGRKVMRNSSGKHIIKKSGEKNDNK